MQVKTYCRVLREKHQGQHNANGACGYHQQHVPKHESPFLAPFKEEDDEPYSQQDGGTGSPYYGCSGYPPDAKAGDMYNAATEKGPISTIPEIPGIIVYCKSRPHVGIYIGNGEVIESTISNRGDGVIKTKLSDFKWEFWFKCPYITYVEENTKPIDISFKAGDTVYIDSSATTYAGVNTKIPDAFKGNKKPYTVCRVKDDRVLLTELYSWVFKKDLKKV